MLRWTATWWELEVDVARGEAGRKNLLAGLDLLKLDGRWLLRLTVSVNRIRAEKSEDSGGESSKDPNVCWNTIIGKRASRKCLPDHLSFSLLSLAARSRMRCTESVG